MSKAAPIQTVIRQHAAAIKAKQDASGAISALRDGIFATTITVPELGRCHISTTDELAFLAGKFEKQQKWPAESPDREAFQERIAAYWAALAGLQALKEQWCAKSGLNDLVDTQWRAIQQECLAWRQITARLRAGRDIPAITRYLGRNGAAIAGAQLQEALRLIGRRGRQ